MGGVLVLFMENYEHPVIITLPLHLPQNTSFSNFGLIWIKLGVDNRAPEYVVVWMVLRPTNPPKLAAPARHSSLPLQPAAPARRSSLLL